MPKTRRRAKGEGTIYPNGPRDWRAQVTIKDEFGRSKRKTLYAKSRDEARRKRDELLRQLHDGTYSDTAVTLEKYLDEWLQEKQRGIKASTFQQYEYCVEDHIKPRLGKFPLKEVTARQVQAMVHDIADRIAEAALERSKARNKADLETEKPDALSRRNGVSTANKCRVILNQVFRHAIKRHIISVNPVEATDALSQDPVEIKTWEFAEASRFLDSVRNHRLFHLFYVEMATGLRRGELLGLRWQDVQGDVLYIRQSLIKHMDGTLEITTPKSARGKRYVAIGPDVIEVLERQRVMQQSEREHLGEAWGGADPNHDLVFTTTVGTWIRPDNLLRDTYRLMEVAEVPRTDLHSLRHLHISMLVGKGLDPRTIADRVGHAKPSFTLDRYSHFFESQRQRSIVDLRSLMTTPADPEQLN